MALSDRGSLPAMERSWILRRHSQRILIGASGVQIVAMLVQLHSSSACVMVAYVLHKWVSMAFILMSAKPKTSLSRVVR